MIEEPASSVPAFEREAEVSALWAADETTAGDIWRRLKDGKTQQQIAEEDGITVGPVYSAINLHNALLTGAVSPSPTVARSVAGRIRTWLKTKSLSDALRQALEEQERLLNAVVENTEASEVESEDALEKSKAAAAENIAGIYVYTLPHYVRYPYDPKTGRTLLKVGHSSVDALYRANAQARVTSLPEDPWLLRIYPTEASSEVEKQFHGFLRDADHSGVRGTRTGAEWFLTSLKFLDRIATTIGLQVRVINDFAINDE
jgi:transcriptional regulator with XRE-family HTH domain